MLWADSYAFSTKSALNRVVPVTLTTEREYVDGFGSVKSGRYVSCNRLCFVALRCQHHCER